MATIQYYRELVPAPDRNSINSGLSPAKHDTMLTLLGVPGKLTVNCSPITNPSLKKRIVTRQCGPIRVTGHVTALASLDYVFKSLLESNPELYRLVGTAGMTCCRAVRGSNTHFSNHSWGTAIDLTVAGILAPLNATRIPRGLAMLYYHFHRYGWYWGAGYRGRTDPMHMEIAQQTLIRWRAGAMI